MNLSDVLQEWSCRPFEFGVSDCCQFAGAVVEAMHGHNPMDQFRYDGETEAQAIIDRYGDLESAVTSVMGDPIPVAKAVPGDVLLLQVGEGKPLLGVLLGGMPVYKTKTGVTDWYIESALKAWSSARCPR